MQLQMQLKGCLASRLPLAQALGYQEVAVVLVVPWAAKAGVLVGLAKPYRAVNQPLRYAAKIDFAEKLAPTKRSLKRNWI